MDFFPPTQEVFELNRFLVISCLIVFFSALFLWPLGWIFRQPRLAGKGAEPIRYKKGFTLSRYFAFLQVMIALLIYFFLKSHQELIDTLNFPGWDSSVSVFNRIFYALPSLFALFLPLQFFFLFWVWLGKHGTPVFRVHYSMLALSQLVFLIFLISWNLVVPGYYLSLLF